MTRAEFREGAMQFDASACNWHAYGAGSATASMKKQRGGRARGGAMPAGRCAALRPWLERAGVKGCRY